MDNIILRCTFKIPLKSNLTENRCSTFFGGNTIILLRPSLNGAKEHSISRFLWVPWVFFTVVDWATGRNSGESWFNTNLNRALLVARRFHLHAVITYLFIPKLYVYRPVEIKFKNLQYKHKSVFTCTFICL